METRTLFAVLLAITLVAPTGAADTLINQVDNPGFEEFSEGTPDEWRILEGLVSSTGTAAEGDLAIQLEAVGEVDRTAIGQNVSLERTDAPIVPNGTYALDFAAWLSSGSETPVNVPPTANATVLWKDALGQTTDVDTVEIAVTDDYVAYNETLDAPVDAVEAEVQFTLERPPEDAQPGDRTDAELKVDDVAFGPADPTSEAEAPATTSPPCGPGTTTIAEVGPVHAYWDSFCIPRAEVDDDWDPTSEASTVPPCNNGAEYSAGPATAGVDPFCQPYADVDKPDPIPLHHKPPEDTVGCLQDAEDGVDVYYCLFGAPLT
jgi:hypothetical protein